MYSCIIVRHQAIEPVVVEGFEEALEVKRKNQENCNAYGEEAFNLDRCGETGFQRKKKFSHSGEFLR
jgi:hypothetical protein